MRRPAGLEGNPWSRALGVLTGAVVALACLPARSEPWPIEAAAGLVRILPGSLAASPDGLYVAYDASVPGMALASSYPQQAFTETGYPITYENERVRLRVASTRDGATTDFTTPTGTSWNASWSPDGRRLAFYSDRTGEVCVWIWDRETGQQRRLSPIAAHPWRNSDRPRWSPDGRSVLFKAIPEGMTLRDLILLNPWSPRDAAPSTNSAVSVNDYRTRSPENRNAAVDRAIKYRFLSDIVAVDVESGAPTRLARAVTPFAVDWSPDGRFVAFTEETAANSNLTTGVNVLDLEVVDAKGRTIFKDTGLTVTEDGPHWSGDAKRLIYAIARHGGGDGCVAATIATAEKTDLCAGVSDGASVLHLNAAPWWSSDGAGLYSINASTGHLLAIATTGAKRWTAAVEGGEIVDLAHTPGSNPVTSSGVLVALVRDSRTRADSFFEIDPKTGAARRLADVEGMAGGAVLAVRDPRRVIFVREDVAQPNEVWALDIISRQTVQLSHLNPLAPAAAMGGARLVDWRSDHGDRLQGSMLLPPHYDPSKRYPTVLWLYGGAPGSERLHRFALGWGPEFDFQVLATRGYVVFYPDIPPSKGQPVDEVRSAVLPGINKLIELGIADPDRLAVMGQSFGGYETIALLTQTQRFKAAVMTSAAATDFFEGYLRFNSETESNFAYYETGQVALRDTPWQAPQRYWENSPIFYLDRVTTPVLIERGAQDKISLANGAVYNGLKRLGKDAEFIVYDYESHGLTRPADVVDFWRRRLAWLEQHLGKP